MQEIAENVNFFGGPKTRHMCTHGGATLFLVWGPNFKLQFTTIKTYFLLFLLEKMYSFILQG